MKLSSLAHLPEEHVSHNPDICKQVMLRSGDLPHLTNFSQARFAPGQISSAHTHQDMCEVFFVAAGIGTIAINGTLYPLTAGTCVAVEPTEIHEIINTGNNELILNYFGLRVESSASLES